MNYLILIILGTIIGLVISTSRNNKSWDLAMGALGALSINAVMAEIGAAYNFFVFLLILAGSIAIIHFGRFLEKFSHN